MRNKASTTLTLVLLSLTLLSTTYSDDLIDQTCKKTPYYELCSNIIHSNPATPSDPKGMVVIIINYAVANATDTLKYIGDLIKKVSDHELQNKLAFCADQSYIPLVKHVLREAVDSINRGDFDLANYYISYAEKDIDACNKKFTGNQSPLSSRNGIMLQLLDISAAILKIL
ncbi:cell wall / vacuolar inhibitor of fructosidase 1-like [Arachis hypogaea]|uniref:cell wall / vacuolar inhibitor of fructosidase 1-like n=1 Tax=Arachis hypogaea TaxID=3818 RepID=UPI000DECB66C|nr:cell wall / vacuolar inhibitor of fructosidase 2-like [Arachis hypogaea]QHO50738.1 Cell wall / vacuolar inhibitor of fructosidase [Arachis hypogaea]